MKTIETAKKICVYSPKGIMTHRFRKADSGDWIDDDCIVVDIVEMMKFFERFSGKVRIVMA